MNKSFSQCSVEGCEASKRAAGMCIKHYKRLRLYGSPTAGGTYKGALPEWIAGVAMRHESDECLRWPFSADRRGYGRLTINGKMCGAHRLVCELASGAPVFPRTHVAHSCGNPWCVNKSHLRWATAKENAEDRFLHGTQKSGEEHHSAKLSNKSVEAIISVRGTEPLSKTAKRFGVSPATISEIQTGKARLYQQGAAQ